MVIDLSCLSASEREVYDLAIEGYSLKEIAQKRNVAKCTVQTQLNSIYQKLVISSRIELMALEIKRLKNELYSNK